jgi:hypothetical protein
VAAATSSFGPTKALEANENNTMHSASAAFTTFEEDRMTCSLREDASSRQGNARLQVRKKYLSHSRDERIMTAHDRGVQ